MYFYEEGSMSDKSHSFDTGLSFPGITSGVAPEYPVECHVFKQP